MPLRKGSDLCCGQRTGLDASVMSPSLSPLCVSVDSPCQSVGRSFRFLLWNAQCVGRCRQREQASKRLLGLGDSSGPAAAHRFGSLLLSVAVCV